MNTTCPVSVSFYPRYKMSGRHLVPLVTSACRRTLYDDGSVDLQEISAEAYRAATKADDAVIGAEKEE
jgi:hypothetical protein